MAMKAKSHSWAKKRVKKTATGKFVFKKACNNHLLTNKKQKNNKSAPYGKLVASTESKALKNLVPYA
jgi:large subunit ribosomal protein L35